VTREQMIEALERISRICTGEDQVADDDTEALGVIGLSLSPILAALRSESPESAVMAEREACAQIAESPYSDVVCAFGPDEPLSVGKKIAAAIRSRGVQAAPNGEKHVAR